MGTHFGFLVELDCLCWDGGQIEPLDDHDDTVRGILAHERHYANWFYPPLASICGGKDHVASKERPTMPATFKLPATHALTLTCPQADADAENFFIALFGMLKGLRLQREGWQHFSRCPTKPGTLCDFTADRAEITQALNLATDFWRSSTKEEVRKLAFGAIHWHLFAQLYPHEFERFNAQYMALDACWALARAKLKLTGRGHGSRPRALSEALNLQTPSWANSSNGATATQLSTRRNALVHEARYAGEPLGFAHPQTDLNMEHELTNFVARCIFALLGVQNEYTRSPVNRRQVWGFAFDESTD